MRWTGRYQVTRDLFSAFEQSRRLHWFSTMTILAVSSVAFLYAWRPAGMDDAWITYRYARNIAVGNGFVYNVGERVQGTSTPLYTLFLAVIGFVFGTPAIPSASYALGWLAFCCTNVLLHKLLAEEYSPAAAWVSTLLIVMYYPVAWISSLGMETPVYVLFIFAAFYLFRRQNFQGAMLVSTLAALTRFEGLIVPAVVFGTFVLRERRIPPVTTLVAPGLLYLARVGFASFYFGSFLPNSLIAKQSHMAKPDYSWWVVGFLARHYLAVPIAILGALSIVFSNWRLLPFAAWPVFYALAYFVSGIRFYPWYVGPLCIGLFVLGGIGVGAVIRIGKHSRTGWFAIGVTIASAAAIAFVPPRFKPGGYITLAEETALEDARYVAALQAAPHIGLGDTTLSRGSG